MAYDITMITEGYTSAATVTRDYIEFHACEALFQGGSIIIRKAGSITCLTIKTHAERLALIAWANRTKGIDLARARVNLDVQERSTFNDTLIDCMEVLE